MLGASSSGHGTSRHPDWSSFARSGTSASRFQTYLPATASHVTCVRRTRDDVYSLPPSRTCRRKFEMWNGRGVL